VPNPLSEYDFLRVYNPWWENPASGFGDLPAFRRDVFAPLFADILRLPQMISVRGPRRVGKSTLLKQCIHDILKSGDHGQAQRILYFPMDDPALSLPGFDPNRFFDTIVQVFAQRASGGPAYLFLDEIQRFPRWELFLKKYYDLRTPVRFVVSGSASAPIFRKSLESLLGRIRDFHVLPFSFREYFFFRLAPADPEAGLSADFRELGNQLRTGHPAKLVAEVEVVIGHLMAMETVPQAFGDYLFEGGFPETWAMPDLLAKQEYLYRNQVERVIFEDLLVAAEFRSPEMLRRFYLELLLHPGRETNLSRLANDLGMARATVETYFPLLEATDLVWRLPKFSGAKATAKATNFKSYLVDLAVRNAVLKLDAASLTRDAETLGAYVENVVANHLRRWPGLVELAYYRERDNELDFIVDLGSQRIGVEVKYRGSLNERALMRSAALAERLKCQAFLVVCKTVPDADWRNAFSRKAALPTTFVPASIFAMLF
jgi:uncharacterized protein